jgi:hypothetical protein
MSSQTNTTLHQRNVPTWYDSAGNVMVRKDYFDEVLQALKDCANHLDGSGGDNLEMAKIVRNVIVKYSHEGAPK